MSLRIILGVAGGIAAYKSCTLLRLLRESGHDVQVVPTDAALRFVGAPTWEALSGRSVSSDVWSDIPDVPHVSLGRWADLVIVAPATADLLARAAAGLADDLLTNCLLTATCPVVMAPAMHTEMWLHPATQANVATLRSRGVVVIDPAVGRLTGSDSGPGRMQEPADIVRLALQELAPTPQDLLGRHVLVSAGGTREPLDPVRFLGNRSSGKQGWAIAARARARGASVTLVAANVELPDPAGITVLRVHTAEEMRHAMLRASMSADVVVMSAAVADFRPVAYADHKIKKADDGSNPEPIHVTRNPDILAELVGSRGDSQGLGGQVIVGFAAETADAPEQLLDLGRAKLARKGCDLLVLNDVSDGAVFGLDENAVVILDTHGTAVTQAAGDKAMVADAILDAIVKSGSWDLMR